MFSGLARKAKAEPQSQTRGRRTRQNNTVHYKQPQYLEPSQAKIRKVKQAKARQGRGRRTTRTQDTRASPRADRPYSRKAQMTPEHQEPRKLWGCGLYPRPFGRQSGTDKRTTNTKQWQNNAQKRVNVAQILRKTQGQRLLFKVGCKDTTAPKSTERGTERRGRGGVTERGAERGAQRESRERVQRGRAH